MMFVLHKTRPTLFVLLTSEDAMKLRDGLTLYVEPRMTGERFFNEVVLGQYRTKDEIIAAIRAADPTAAIPDHLPEPPPREGEIKCRSCGGSNRPEQLYESTCIVCWATAAKRLRTASN